MGTHGDALAVAQAYHRAWTSGDFASARGSLAADLETDVPLNTYAGATEWMQAVERTRNMAQGVEMLAEFSNDGEALLLYDMRFPPPIGTLRIAEHFTVRDARVTRIRHVHDTHALRSAALASSPATP